ncbi:hypothetical protein LSM04_006395 [Trypanosoma melophagium]|uniref:uncharacterized protein n=1 Tax=Trypanosoma melophagium TaxID=715481 RepID=UPI00351A4168|nr:hypothetical protein LSM04_006395 [Trypanosoma melophagium]
MGSGVWLVFVFPPPEIVCWRHFALRHPLPPTAPIALDAFSGATLDPAFFLLGRDGAAAEYAALAARASSKAEIITQRRIQRIKLWGHCGAQLFQSRTVGKQFRQLRKGDVPGWRIEPSAD